MLLKGLNILNYDDGDGCPKCNSDEVDYGDIWDGIDYLHYRCYNCDCEYGVATGNYPGFRIQYIDEVIKDSELIKIINKGAK